MASITRKTTSKYWIACFTDHTGKQRQKSTKQTDRRKAIKAAEQFETAYREKMGEAQARRILESMLREVHNERGKLAVTVREFFADWLAGKKVETSNASFAKYERVVQSFMDFLGDGKSGSDLALLSGSDIERFRNTFASNHSTATTNSFLKIIRGALEGARRKRLISENPADTVPTIKKRIEENGRRPFTVEELQKIIAVADPEWRAIIHCGLYSGQRLGDIAFLTWANVDIEQKEIALTTRKTGRRIVVPMAAPLEKVLMELPSSDDPTGPLFPRAFEIVTKQAGHVGGLSNQFYRIMTAAGLVPKRTNTAQKSGRGGKRETAGLGFHCLRHTATSMMKNAGISPATVMDIIGHDSAAVSRIYTHVDVETKRRAIQSLPQLQ